MLGFYAYIVAACIVLNHPLYRMFLYFYNESKVALSSINSVFEEIEEPKTQLLECPRETSCESLKHELLMEFGSIPQFFIAKSSFLSAEYLIKVYECLLEDERSSSLRIISSTFAQWNDLKIKDSSLYCNLLNLIDIENCSMSVLRSIPVEDLIVKLKDLEGFWDESLINKLPMREILSRAIEIDADFEFWKKISVREFSHMQPDDKLKLLTWKAWKELDYAGRLRWSIRTEEFFLHFLQHIGEVAFPSIPGFSSLMDFCKAAVDAFVASRIKEKDEEEEDNGENGDKVVIPISRKMSELISRIETAEFDTYDDVLDAVECPILRALFLADLFFFDEFGFDDGQGENERSNGPSSILLKAFSGKTAADFHSIIIKTTNEDRFVQLEALRMFHRGSPVELLALFENFHTLNAEIIPIYSQKDVHSLIDWIRLVGELFDRDIEYTVSNFDLSEIPVHAALFNSIFKLYGRFLQKDLRSIIQDTLKPLIKDKKVFFNACESLEVKTELLLPVPSFVPIKTLRLDFFDYRASELEAIRRTLAKVYEFYEANQSMSGMVVQFEGMRGQDSGGLGRHLIVNVLMALSDDRLGLFHVTESNTLVPRTLLDPNVLGWLGSMHAQALILGVKVPWSLELNPPQNAGSSGIKLKDIVDDLVNSSKVLGKGVAAYPAIEDIKNFAIEFCGSKSRIFHERFDLSNVKTSTTKPSQYTKRLKRLENECWNEGIEAYRSRLLAGLDKSLVSIEGLFGFLMQLLKPLDVSLLIWSDVLACFEFGGSAGHRARSAFTRVLKRDPVKNIPLLLEFVYGSSSLPPAGLGALKIVISAIFVEEGRDAKFPHVSTCTGLVTWNIGVEESDEDLEERLLQSIDYAKNFDQG